MAKDLDEEFYARADAHIHLANDQCAQIARGKVSASMMYATARFNAWVSACGFQSREEMATARAETIRYFTDQYRKMLEDNFEDYTEHFDSYMKPKQGSKS